LQQAIEAIERLRIVKEIPKGYWDDQKAQGKTMDILAAILNLIGQQLSHFTILKNQPEGIQKAGDFMLLPLAHWSSTGGEVRSFFERRRLRKCAEGSRRERRQLQPVPPRSRP